MSDMNGKRGVLARAFDILGCFAHEPERSVSEICTLTGLPPATVHRMLATLADHDAIARTGRGRYRLGPSLWRLGHDVPEIRALRDAARPALVDLHASTRLPVALASSADERIQLIDKITGSKTVRAWTELGTPYRDQHPAGLVLHAWNETLPRRVTAQAIGISDFRWQQEMAQIRRDGFACSPPVQEGRSPLVWAAAPIMQGGKVETCVLIGGKRGEHPPVALGRLVRTTARDISAHLQRLADVELNGAHG